MSESGTPGGKSAARGRAAWGMGRVAVRAHWPEIRSRVAEGAPLSMVYRELEAKLAGISYGTFCYQAGVLLRKEADPIPASPPRVAPQNPVAPPPASSAQGPRSLPPQPAPRFEHRALPDKESLV